MNYPPGYETCRDLRAYLWLSRPFTRMAEVNRFAARYRLAKSCKVTLDGYSTDTAGAYDAIVRVALCWSAVESLMAAMGVSKHQLATVSARHDWAPVLDQMRQTGNIAPFFRFVEQELDTLGQKQTVAKFIAGEPCCGLTLAKAVRHIFFHGTLTPNANGADAAAVRQACGVLADALFAAMDAEFLAGVARLEADAELVNS